MPKRGSPAGLRRKAGVLALLVVGLAAAPSSAQTGGVRRLTSQPRADALVQCVDGATGQVLVGAGVTFSVHGTTVLVRTDHNGVAYCGDRDSELSVYSYGSEIAFVVSYPGYQTQAISRELPRYAGGCRKCAIKRVETFGVELLPIVSNHPGDADGEVTGEASAPTAAPSKVPDGEPMCRYREVYVRCQPVPCNESTRRYASATYVDGVCPSPIDWSNSKEHTFEHSADWSRELTVDASSAISRSLGVGVHWVRRNGQRVGRTVRTKVVAQGQLGRRELPGWCGNICMNALQREIITQRQRQCCVRQNGWGCLKWGGWRDVGEPIVTRVITGFCTTGQSLFRCDDPPKVWPPCSK